MLRSIFLHALFLLLVLTGCASDDGAQAPSDEDSWRTASQRVPDQSRRPSPSEMARQANARDLAAQSEGEEDSEDESGDGENSGAAEKSTEIPEKPIRLDPNGPDDRDSYVRWIQEMPRLKALKKPTPDYTEEARKAGVEGVVIVDVLVDDTGTVRGVDLVKGLPGGLVLETYKTVKKWKFEPLVIDGEPIKVIQRFTANFRTSGASE